MKDDPRLKARAPWKPSMRWALVEKGAAGGQFPGGELCRGEGSKV